MEESLKGKTGYVQYEYVDKPLKDLFAAADLMVSRAGANAICEILALKKPNLLIPLSAKASRGDQILNARSFERQGFSKVMEEEELTEESLLSAIEELWRDREKYIENMKASNQSDGVKTVIELIEKTVSEK